MKPFGYLRDGLFLCAAALYALNRLVLKPLAPGSFFASWFNDLLLIPCALPVLLWIERRVGLRNSDIPPTPAEIAFVLVLWSVLFEIVAPRLMRGTTGDWLDMAAYSAGAVAAGLWWNRTRLPGTG